MFDFESIKIMEFALIVDYYCVQSQFRSCSNFENSVGGISSLRKYRGPLSWHYCGFNCY